MNLKDGKRGGAPCSDARDGGTVKGEDHRMISGAVGLPKKGLGEIAPHEVLRRETSSEAVSRLTHDMGNLLQIASNAVHLIQRNLERTAGPQLHVLIQSALSSVERAGTLCRNISNFPVPESSFNESIDLGQTLLGIRDLIYLIAGPSINIEFELQPSDLVISCSEQDLENVILNLVINAKDAMPDGGSLTFSAYRRDGIPGLHQTQSASCSDVVLCVRDTGCGMSPEVARQVFQPFFTTKAVGKGSGIGLATVKNFARRLGGTAEIESVIDQGTSVILCIPGSRKS
jgi:signal transduction histidine kinase